MSLGGVVSSRFAVAVHILLYMSWHAEGPSSSAKIAGSVNTNPVVVRRLMSALREAGIVTVLQGADGGALLARPVDEILLSEVFRAVEKAALFSGHPQHPNADCVIGRQVPAVLAKVFDTAETALLDALSTFTLGSVWRELAQRVQDETHPEDDVASSALAGISSVLSGQRAVGATIP